jgi:hypothetical protein
VVTDEDGASSRRALLGGAGAALAGVGAFGLAGCGKKASTGRKAVKKAPPAVAHRDVEILVSALALERRTVAAYVAGIPLLSHKQAKMAKQFLGEELEHTGELLSLIKAAGGTAPPRSDSYDIGHPRDQGGVLAVLQSLEALQIANYLRSIPHLAPGPVRAAVATILADDAQHISILRLAQGENPVPTAFVTAAG